MSSVHDFSAKSIDGSTVKLDKYAGKLVLVVNVASQCGLTPQYTGLEALYRKYKDKGLVILGFPCDQFLNQEPGSDQDIEQFCSLNYDVTFPLFSKIEVNGPQAHPLYTYMRAQQPGKTPDAATLANDPLYKFLSESLPDLLKGDVVKWNFTKFLVGRDGKVLKRFEPTVQPEQIEQEIQSLLG
jgi:glutathione peroxidase